MIMAAILADSVVVASCALGALQVRPLFVGRYLFWQPVLLRSTPYGVPPHVCGLGLWLWLSRLTVGKASACA